MAETEKDDKAAWVIENEKEHRMIVFNGRRRIAVNPNLVIAVYERELSDKRTTISFGKAGRIRVNEDFDTIVARLCGN